MKNLVIGSLQEGLRYWSEVNHLKAEFAATYRNVPNMHTWKQLSPSVSVFIKKSNGIITAFIFAGGVFICWNWLETLSGFDNDWVKLLPESAMQGSANTVYQQKLGIDRPYSLTNVRNRYWTDGSTGLSWYANEIHKGGFKYSGLAVIIAAALLPGNSVIIIPDPNTLLIVDLQGPVVTEGMTGLALYSGSYTIRSVITGDGSLIGKNLVWAEFSKDLTYAVMVTTDAATYHYDGNILVGTSGNIEFWRVDFSLSTSGSMTFTFLSSDSLDYHVPTVFETGRGTWAPYTYTMTCGPMTKYTGNFALVDGSICGTYHTETLSMYRSFHESETVHIVPTGTFTINYEVGVFRVDVITGAPTTLPLHTYQRANTATASLVSNDITCHHSLIYNPGTNIVADEQAHVILYVNYKSNTLVLELISRRENYSRAADDTLTASMTNQGTSIVMVSPTGATELWSSYHNCLSRYGYQAPGYTPDLLDKYPPNLPNTFYMVGYENIMFDRYIDENLLGAGGNFATLNEWSAARVSSRHHYNIEPRGLYPYNITYELNPLSEDPKKTFLLKTVKDEFTGEYTTTIEMELDTPDMYPPITLGSA